LYRLRKKIITLLKNNIYVTRIATLMSGTFVAQLVILLLMPVLTRLYTPAEFGFYSLFISVTIIIGLVSSLKYDQAIMLPSSDKNALSLLVLAASITLVVSFFTAAAVLLFSKDIASYFGGVPYIVLLLPVSVLLIGLVQIFTAYSSRYQFYKRIAGARIFNAISMVSIQAGSKGYFNFDGLIIGRLIADFICLYILIKKLIIENTLNLRSVNIKRIRLNARRYDNFPRYQSVTVFFNAISQNMPILLFGVFYSLEIAGFYALTVRILKAPIGLISASTKEVYYQTAAKMHAQGESILHLYLKTTIGLGKLVVVPSFVVLFFGEYLFEYVFGKEWAASGAIAQILIIWFALGFVNSPSSITYSILGAQKIQMQLEAVSLLLRFFSIYLGYKIFDSYIVSIVLFMLVSVAINVFSLIYIYRKLKHQG